MYLLNLLRLVRTKYDSLQGSCGVLGRTFGLCWLLGRCRTLLRQIAW